MTEFKNVKAAMLFLGITLVATCASSRVSASEVKLSVELGTPVMMEGVTQTAFLKVGLKGFASEEPGVRTPINVSIVLDRSGSMSGEKMRKAKEAAIMAIDRLGPDDIVSVVAYNHTVEVLVPATKVRNRHQLRAQINRLFSSGNTALFAGVSKGAHEVRKFMERNRVNRVILLSDGLANVGPSSPGDLAHLGWSLSKEGVSVTTIGLGNGYNEDLMVALARNSDGNHAFAENAHDLTSIFSYEFGDLMSVVARNVRIQVRCAPGVKPVRVLGRRAEISGRDVFANMSQLYADQEKFLLLEVEVPPNAAGSKMELATVDVKYDNTIQGTTDLLGNRVHMAFSNSWSIVDSHRNESVMVSSIELIANEAAKSAIALRDQGMVFEAEQALENNARYLETESKKYKSKKLKKSAAKSRRAKQNLDDNNWKKQRKVMFDDAFQADMQQAW